MELSPGPMRRAAALLMQPLSGPENLHAAVVDYHVRSPSSGPSRPPGRRCGGKTGCGSCAGPDGLGHREIEAEQIHDRTKHAFGLTPRPTECQPQHQAHFDDDIQYPRPAALPPRRRHIRPSSRLCNGPSGFYAGAVHLSCMASGSSGSAGELYTRPAFSAPIAISAPTSNRMQEFTSGFRRNCYEQSRLPHRKGCRPIRPNQDPSKSPILRFADRQGKV
jgi:hypothetical protein